MVSLRMYTISPALSRLAKSRKNAPDIRNQVRQKRIGQQKRVEQQLNRLIPVNETIRIAFGTFHTFDHLLFCC